MTQHPPCHLLTTLGKDTLTHILLHIKSTRVLGLVAQTNSIISQAIPWFEHAQRVCGWEVSDQGVTDRLYAAKHLLRPWLSRPQVLNVKFDDPDCRTRIDGITAHGPDHLLAKVAVTDPDGTHVNFVLTPCRPNVNTAKWVHDINDLPVPPPMTDAEEELHDYVNEHRLIPSDYHDYDESRVYTLHDGAFAFVMASYVMHDDDAEKQSTHVLIFSTEGKRLLHVFDSLAADQYYLVIKPGEFWFINKPHQIIYIGPRGDKAIDEYSEQTTVTKAFCLASTGDYDRAIATLNAKHIPLTAICNIHGGTLLHYATLKRHDFGVNTLVKNGFPVDFQTGIITTALMSAINMRSGKMIKALLDNGADPNQRDRFNTYALFRALHKNVPAIAIKALLHHKAAAHVFDDRGRSPLFYVHPQASDKIILMLRKAGADIYAPAADGAMVRDVWRRLGRVW